LTDLGRRRLDETLEDHLENEHKLIASLSAEECERLASLLRRWLKALGDEDRPAQAKPPG
jgi:hypothetical protein